ncbi:hypothetical protein [Streptomyces hebeiensis]
MTGQDTVAGLVARPLGAGCVPAWREPREEVERVDRTGDHSGPRCHGC